MRGRLTYAMYRQMSYGDLIARNSDQYVQLALRMGSDPGECGKSRAAILECCDKLYGDGEIVHELEEFWDGAAEQRNKA